MTGPDPLERYRLRKRADLAKHIQTLFTESLQESFNLPEDAHIEIETPAMDKRVRRAAEKRERELRGAWRAGYDWVHVYTTVYGHPQAPIREDRCIPSDDRKPKAMPTGYVYDCSYDLGAVDDKRVLEVLDR